MRDFADGEFPFANDFNAITRSRDNYYVESGMTPSVGSGMDTDIAVGNIIVDGIPMAYAGGSVTHAAEATLARRYDLVCAYSSSANAAIIIVQGTVNKKAPAIPAGYILLAVVQIDNGSTAPDAVNDARITLLDRNVVKVGFPDNRIMTLEDDFLGTSLSHLWGYSGSAGGTLISLANGYFNIAGVAGQSGALTSSTGNFEMSREFLLVAKLRPSTGHANLNWFFRMYRDASNYFEIRSDGQVTTRISGTSYTGNIGAISTSQDTEIYIWNDSGTIRFRQGSLWGNGLWVTPTATLSLGSPGFINFTTSHIGGGVPTVRLDYIKCLATRHF